MADYPIPEDLLERTDEFTRNRIEEIRQVDEELAWVESEIWTDSQQDSPSNSDSPKRILARLQSALAELKKGMG
jgi:hypothetical protein